MDDNSFKYLNDRLRTIETIVLGNPELNIPSINDRLRGIDGGIERMSSEIIGINAAMREMLRGKERERWIQYAISFFLALTSVSMIAVFLLLMQLLRQ